MSPDARLDDERLVGATVAALMRRARVLALVEALAWSAAVAVATRSALAATAVGAAVSGWRWRGAVRKALIRGIERANPSARNVFVTADELARGRLTTTDALRARVFADAAAVARATSARAVVPAAPAVRAVVVAVLLGLASWSAPLWRGRVAQVASIGRPARTPGAPAGAASLHVRATVQPPAYTGLPATILVDPEQLQAIEGSVLAVTIDTAAERVTAEHDGASIALARGADRRFAFRAQLTKTGFLVLSSDRNLRRTIPIVVTPDALPSVRLTAPGRDLVYAGGDRSIAFAAHATDDFGLRSLVLRYTRVSGSGENFAFQDGEIPLQLTRTSPRDWTGSITRSLAALDLKDGDMLVYRAVAADARPGDGSGSSDAFFIEISRLGAAAGDAFTLPEEESRYALSQQMLIVKTERLHRQRAALAPADLNEQALNLAVEQRMIRAEFVFMLGGEVEDEEVEAQQSTELQEGRLENRGQRDVRAATVAMSQAGTFLTAANTGDALVAERAAVTALQRAFSRDRYILRALGVRSQLDAARRLTGSLAGAGDWRRAIADAPANRRAVLLQDLVRGIGEAAASTPAPQAAGALRLLAEEAVSIDPSSAPLRQAATELQRAADGGDASSRARSIAAALAAATAEARRAYADAPIDARAPAPALTGAFADALVTAAPRPR